MNRDIKYLVQQDIQRKRNDREVKKILNKKLVNNEPYLLHTILSFIGEKAEYCKKCNKYGCYSHK